MRNLLTNRFEPRKILEHTRGKITFVGRDHVSGKSDVLIKIFRKGYFSCNRKELATFFTWHRSVTHPFLARVFDAGLTANQDLYYVREYFDEDASALTGQTDWIGQLLAALSTLHLGNHVHASIKPSNVFRSDGSVKLADPRLFQLKPSGPTQEDICFTAPEILAGADPTVESDLYSVGAVLYRALSGTNPFSDPDTDNLKTKCMWASPQPLSSICHVSESTSDLVACLLQKDPRNRPGMASFVSAFPNTTRATHAALADREEQLGTMEEFFDRSSPLNGVRVALIEGEPGIGKTRFIEELAARARFHAAEYAVGHCEETESISPRPIVQSLQNILRQRGLFSTSEFRKEFANFWPTLQHLIDGESAAQEDPAYPPERVISDLVGLVRLLAQERPFTIAIDDAHLANESTLEVIRQLCLRSTEMSLNLLLARRTSHQRFKLQDLVEKCLHENFRTVRLPELTPAAARQVASYLVTSSEKRAIVLNKASGNPLFLEEYALCDDFRDKFPPRIERLWTSIVGSMSKCSVEVAGTLAIFHKPVPRNSLQAISRVSGTEFDSAISELSEVGLIDVTATNVAFKNDSFRNRFNALLSRSRRTRFHQLAYKLFNGTSNEELLAHHSFHGRLYDVAAGHCLKTAKKMCEEANFPAAIHLYNRAQFCLRQLGRELDSAASADLALCYLRIGKASSADKIYQRLLAGSPASVENRSLFSSIYVRLTHPEYDKDLSERLLLCSRALETAPTDWSQLSVLYARLAQTLVDVGQLLNAERALQLAQENLTKHASESNAVLVYGSEGYFLLHSGKFREAITAFQSIKRKRSMLALILTNIALCWEHLGDLRRATRVQLEAQNVAETMGHAYVCFLSLINLGAVETKLGNFAEASRSFTSARNLISQLRTRDRRFRPAFISVLHLDLARLHMELGRYQDALRYLKLARTLDNLALEGGNLRITDCELNIQLGDTATAKSLLNGLDRSEVFRTEFFSVERSLLESCLADIDPKTTLEALVQALRISTKIETLYQRTKILNQLSAVCRELGQGSEARMYAKDALRLAQKHGYKPLEARALFALGLASENQEKEKNLIAALHMASEIGLRELLAESAFQIGFHRYSAGHYVTAEEYLVKSISEINELSAQVPRRLRTRYLSETWRATAQKLLQECKTKIQTISFLRSRPLEQHKDQQYIRALYRLTLSSATLGEPDDFLSSVLETLETSIQRPILLTLHNSKNIVRHSSRIKFSDDLRDRIRALTGKSKDGISVETPDTGQTGETIAWIPLRAHAYTGGIYIACSHREPPLTEREIEFLTIVRAITNEALDRIETRRVEEARLPQADDFQDFHGIIGASKTIREVYSHIQIAAGNAATVLIEGESGTGKELVAKAIHETGQRAKEPFVAVDCGAIPETLIEAELFGARKGSYTGAVVDRPGLFEAAHRGTIFLDEISNTSPAVQAKLLRVLQEREVRRIGETRGRPVDVRLIVASNANLDALVREGRFRRDLLYRLKVLHIKLPPLRNRRDDIPMLAHAFLERLNAANKTKKHFAPGIINQLMTQPFPGNVRELQNVVERAFFLAKGTIISEVPLEAHAEDVSSSDEVQSWFKELSEGRKDFWSAVHNRYKRRDISREKVIALMDYGLRSTQGSYKMMAAMFHLKENEYRRFMDFLRRNNCLLDYRPYRKAARNTP